MDLRVFDKIEIYCKVYLILFFKLNFVEYILGFYIL